MKLDELQAALDAAVLPEGMSYVLLALEKHRVAEMQTVGVVNRNLARRHHFPMILAQAVVGLASEQQEPDAALEESIRHMRHMLRELTDKRRRAS